MPEITRSLCRRLARTALIAASLPAAMACAQAPVERPIHASTIEKGKPPGSTTIAAVTLSPSAAPAPGEIEEALRRVFGSTLRLDPPAGTAGFFVGDFNADGVEDLALVTRPAPDALPALNDALAAWIVRDAQRPTPAVVTAADRTNGIEKDDLLLAVVHGYGTSGWRNPETRHGYLLRHAVAAGMRATPSAEVIQVSEPGAHAVGHVLTGTIDGRSGFLYWTGTRYLWHRL